MRKIEGTATISIEQLDDLRQQQDFSQICRGMSKV